MSTVKTNRIENEAGDGVNVSTLAQMALGSMKNKLINGDKRVNQRVYADTVLADGVYGYDRWRGNASDVNIEQVIEQQSIRSGTYTISFLGGGTATVNGTSGLSSGDSLSITVAGNISVIIPKSSTDIQLEEGSVATPFEARPIGLELSLCQRYYEQVGFSYRGSPSTALAGAVGGTSYFRVEKRIVPTLTVIGTDYFENASSGVSTSSISNIAQSATATATSRSRWVGILACDAEL